MSENAKSNTKKLLIGLVLALLGAGGADAAGLQFDPALVRDLGLGGGLALIVYLHLQVRPLLVAGTADLAAIRQALAPAAQVEHAEATDVGPDPIVAADIAPKPVVALVRRPRNGEV